MKQVKISERKLKKAEEDITRIINDLFKSARGIEWIEPSVTIHLHAHVQTSKKVFERLDVPVTSTGAKMLSSQDPYFSSPLTIYIHRD